MSSSESNIVADDIIKDLRRRMDGAIDSLRKDLSGLRTGRASAALLDPVTVEAYGNEMPLNQVATVSVPEARLLTVQVWDKSMVKATEKAIREAGLGLNPQTDGQMIRVPLPDLNEDRRRELVKIANKYAEQARISIRNIRRDGIDHAKKQEKAGELNEDLSRKMTAQVQSLTDDYVRKVDEAFALKEKDILQV